ncbi:MAG: hypothetical protein QXD62_04090 [Candidatus Woesearchaeota archaeon]
MKTKIYMLLLSMFLFSSVYSELVFETLHSFESYKNYYFIPDNQFIFGYQKITDDDILLYCPSNLLTINITKYKVGDVVFFFLPLSLINCSYFIIYEKNYPQTYHFVILPLINLQDSLYYINMQQEGKVINEVITAMSVVYFRDEFFKQKALNYLLKSRNDDYKCWGYVCDIETTLLVLYYLKKAGYENLKMYSDAEVWLKSQIKTSDKSIDVIISPIKSDTVCNISKKGEISLSDVYSFKIPFSFELLNISCNQNVHINLIYKNETRTYKTSFFEFIPEVNCLGRKTILDPCHPDLNIIAKNLNFNVDLSPWIKKDEVVGRFVNSSNKVLSTALYLKNINADEEMVKWLMYYQRNDGSWSSDFLGIISVLDFLKDYRKKSSDPKINETYYNGLIWFFRQFRLNPRQYNDSEIYFILEKIITLLEDKILNVNINNPTVISNLPYTLTVSKRFLDSKVISFSLSSKNKFINPFFRNFTETISLNVSFVNNLKSMVYFDVLVMNITELSKNVSQLFYLPVIFEIKPFLRLKDAKIDNQRKIILLEFEKSFDDFVCEMSTDIPDIVIDNRLFIDNVKIEIPFRVKRTQNKIVNTVMTLELKCKKNDQQFYFSREFNLTLIPSNFVELGVKNLEINKIGKGELIVPVKNLLDSEIRVSVEILNESFIFSQTNQLILAPKESKELVLKYSIPDIDNYTSTAILRFKLDYENNDFPIVVKPKKAFNFTNAIPYLIFILIIVIFNKFVFGIVKFIVRSLPIFVQKLLPEKIVDWAWQGIPRNKELFEKVKILKDKTYLKELEDLIAFYKGLNKPEYQIIEVLKQKGFKDVEIQLALEEWKEKQKKTSSKEEAKK